MEPPYTHTHGSYVVKLNPDWDWVNRGQAGGGNGGGGGGPTLADSWDVSHQDDIVSYGLKATVDMVWQAITSAGGKLSSVKVSLKRSGTPVGGIVISLYPAIGTVGTTAIPNPPWLAVSDPIDASLVSNAANGALTEFFFTGLNQFQMVSGEKYCIAVGKNNINDWSPPNYVMVGQDFSGGAGHPGNTGIHDTFGYQPDDYGDMIFYLFTA